ncbi:MAG: hypothetical protein AAF570_18125, partial [Bacteroidota bacterium]
QLGSMFRGGFAGAGNAVSYAFFETLAAKICGDRRPAREKLTESVLNMPIGDKYRFFRELELLKKMYNKSRRPEYTYDYADFLKLRFQFAGDNRLEFFLDDIQEFFINSKKSLKDYYGIIGNTIDLIAKHITDLVERTGIRHFDKVILSGRSFLMDDYRERIQAALRDKFKVDDFLFAEKDLKKSCLFGPLAIPEGTNYNSDLVGTPVVTNRAGKIISLFDRIRGFKPRTENRRVTNLHFSNFYLDGLDLTLGQDRLTVCGRELILPNFDADTVNVVYVGDGFLARTEDECEKLNFAQHTGQQVESDPLAWMSLFPYVDPPPMMSPMRMPIAEAVPTNDATSRTHEHTPAGNAQPATPTPNSVPTTSPDPNDDMWDYI